MGTEVLHPQDCLVGRMKVPRITYPYQRTYCQNYSNPWSGRSKFVARRYHNHKDSPSRISTRSSFRNEVTSPKSLSIGHFTLIRRGEYLEALDNIGEKDHISTISNNQKIGRSFTEKQVTIDGSNLKPFANTSTGIYAGSAFAVSPSPESLPLPSFPKKTMTIDGLATKDLRRLLGLD